MDFKNAKELLTLCQDHQLPISEIMRQREIIVGETTGVVEFPSEEIRVDEKPVQTAPQGVFCSVKVPSPIRRGDKLYKFVSADQVEMQQ